MKTYYYIYKITILKGGWKDHYYIGKRGPINCLPEEDWYMCCFLSENFTIHGILLALITVFVEDLNVEIDYDEDNPIECEDGEIIYQKYLKVELA